MSIIAWGKKRPGNIYFPSSRAIVSLVFRCCETLLENESTGSFHQANPSSFRYPHCPESIQQSHISWPEHWILSLYQCLVFVVATAASFKKRRSQRTSTPWIRDLLERLDASPAQDPGSKFSHTAVYPAPPSIATLASPLSTRQAWRCWNHLRQAGTDRSASRAGNLLLEHLCSISKQPRLPSANSPPRAISV